MKHPKAVHAGRVTIPCSAPRHQLERLADGTRECAHCGMTLTRKTSR